MGSGGFAVEVSGPLAAVGAGFVWWLAARGSRRARCARRVWQLATRVVGWSGRGLSGELTAERVELFVGGAARAGY